MIAWTVDAIQDASFRAGTITEAFEKEDEVANVETDFSTKDRKFYRAGCSIQDRFANGGNTD